jgi:acetoin utilization deacetylase AcuC-like enzyme
LPHPHLPIVTHPDYRMDIGSHVFPTDKYLMALDLLRSEGYAPPEAIQVPEAVTDTDLLLVHTAAYLEDLEQLRWTPRTMYSELPLTSEIVRGFRLMAGGSVLAARLALKGGVAMHLGGGFHHAFADHAEGFCYLNDIAVAIRVMQREGRIRRAAVLDVDLHQGNGTAHIFLNDPEVLTFSIHQEELYPEKQKSDIDIGLPSYANDDIYLSALRQVVPERIVEHKPELLVYVAGADPFEEDQLGDLQLTIEGLKERDRIVANACYDYGWPMATVLAGGYAADRRDTARIHANTAVVMARTWGISPVGPV